MDINLLSGKNDMSVIPSVSNEVSNLRCDFMIIVGFDGSDRLIIRNLDSKMVATDNSMELGENLTIPMGSLYGKEKGNDVTVYVAE